MECLQFFPDHVTLYLCQSSALPVDLSALPIPTIYWVLVTVVTLMLWGILWYKRSKASFGFLPTHLPLLWGNQTPIAHAERLLRESMTPREYEFLLHFGYLEIPSKLYPTIFYRILRKRRVQVYDLCQTGMGQRYQKLGELWMITQESMLEADIILLHKWLIEADEHAYLETTNWVDPSDKTRLLQASGSYAIQHVYRELQARTMYFPASC